MAAIRPIPNPTPTGADLGDLPPHLKPAGASALDSSDFTDLDEAFRRALSETGDADPRGSAGSPTGAPPPVPLSVGAVKFDPPPALHHDPAGETGSTPTRAYADAHDADALLGALYEHGPKSQAGDVRFPAPESANPADVDRPEPKFPPPMSSAFPRRAAALVPPGDPGDIPGLLAADDNPFADIDAASPYSSSGIPADVPFDMNLAPTGAPAPEFDMSAVDATAGSTRLARIDVMAGPTPELALPPGAQDTTLVIRSYSPPPPPPAATPPEGRWPTLAGVLVGLIALVLLLPDLGQRAVEALLPGDWGVEWSGAVAPPTPVRVNQAKVSTYPAKDGRELLVVAGDARNRTERLLKGVEVVVGVYDGTEQVDERRRLVDVVLTEGQLTEISDGDELDAAYAEAARAHGTRGVVLPPGVERPFMVVFPEVPDRARALRYRISFDIR